MTNNLENFFLPLPQVIRLEPSSLCNFRCRHCTNGLGLNKSLGIMSREVFDKIFDKIKDYHFRVAVLYHGGEPLLNPDLFYFLERMKKISDFIKMDCNGSLLTDENINRIIASPLNHLMVSLDGQSPEENDKIRLGSNFEKISGQLIKLLEMKRRQKPDLKITIANVQIPSRDTDISKIEPPPFLLERFAAYLDFFNIVLIFAYKWPGYPAAVSNQFKRPVRNQCDNIVSTITIRWNGDIVPCCYDIASAMVLGNIFKQSFSEIWNNEKYLNLRRDVNQFHPPPQLCGDCSCSNLYDQTTLYREDMFYK